MSIVVLILWYFFYITCLVCTADYIQKAIFYFYEWIKDKRLKNIFKLEKYVNELEIKDSEIKISFKLTILNKLINIYQNQ